MPERSKVAYIRGIVYRIPWDPDRPVDVAAGSYTAYAYTVGGAIADRRVARLSATTRMRAIERAIIQGRLHYRLVDRPWAGHWLPATPGVMLR